MSIWGFREKALHGVHYPLPWRVPHHHETPCRHRPYDKGAPEEGPATRDLADEQPDPERIQHRFLDRNQDSLQGPHVWDDLAVQHQRDPEVRHAREEQESP